MPDFGDAERRMLHYFKLGQRLFFDGEEFLVEEVGKPTCPSGEPKTDIYVLIANKRRGEEIKISYKKENADFLENKTNSVRAEQLFGRGWEAVIEDSTLDIEERFREKALIYTEKFGRTEKGAITLGWKFELLNKPGGELSGRMNLTRQQVYDVYAGTNLSRDKRDAMVNGVVVRNSGVADYILMTDNVSSAQDIIDRMIPIDDYIDDHPDIYFACKALNYRTFANKYDGDRPLSVQVDWHIEDGRLTADLVFDRPLTMNGHEMANRLLACLRRLGIRNTDDISDDNADMNKVY